MINALKTLKNTVGDEMQQVFKDAKNRHRNIN